VRDSEVQEVFGLVVETPLAGFELHPEEVDAVVGLSLPAARRLLVERRTVVAAELRRDEPVERPVRLENGLFVCGDHRDTASLHGAMVSGRRAAEAVLGRA